ncbi:MAG: DUF4097 family beta strand repeat protein [Ruminococcus sp.]|nr:DUF4097 family beta strand repeat protein [Ruminococcus sp.]
MTKKLLIAGTALVITGAVICAGAGAAFGFDFSKLDTANSVTNTYPVSDDFSSISIKADTDDVIFVPSKDGKCSVVCVEDSEHLHDVRVENDTLVIDQKDENKISWHFMSVGNHFKTTVYLPESQYKELSVIADTGDLDVPKEFSFDKVKAELDTGDVSWYAPVKESISIRTDTGSITASDISAESMEMKSDTGDIKLTNIQLTEEFRSEEDTGDVIIDGMTCKDFYSKGNTGDLKMTKVEVSQKMDLDRDTGDIDLEDCDADEIFIVTDTGDVKGTLLSEKVFITKTDTGDVNVPNSISGGRCEITTDTGDINISLR